MLKVKTRMVELLEEIADKEPPKTILYDNYVWKLYEKNDYYCKDKGTYLFDYFDDVQCLIEHLNDEVLIKVDD